MSNTDLLDECKTCKKRYENACPLLTRCSHHSLELKLGETICDNEGCKSYFTRYDNNCGMVPSGCNIRECVTYQIWKEVK